jgi:predicted ArsR family transcriptional regulator
MKANQKRSRFESKRKNPMTHEGSIKQALLDAILLRMQDYGGHTIKDIARVFKITELAAERHLHRLYKDGLADRDDPCGKGKEYIYWPGV